MGLCPCPRCLIAKAAIPKLGTVRDFRDRIRWARHDDIRYRTKIDIARNIIYNKGFSLTGSALQNVLKTESLVPTRVRLSHITIIGVLMVHSECLLGRLVVSWIRFLSYASS